MQIGPDTLIVLIISGFGILLCLSVGGYIWMRQDGKRVANILLGLLLITYSLDLLNSLFATTGVYSAYQFLYFIPLIFSFSLGPLFYLFVKARIQPGFRMDKKQFVHLVLPAIQFGFYLSVGFRSAEYKSWLWRTFIQPYGQYIESILVIFLTVGYLVAALILIKKELPSALWKHPVCQWLKRFAFVLLILYSISFIYEIMDWVLWNYFEYNLYNIPWLDFPLKLSQALISIYIGYNAFIYQQQSIITPSYYPDKTDNDLESRMDELLRVKQVHLDPEFDLSTMAKMLNIHRNKVSKYFSSKGQNFRSVINQARVQNFIDLVEAGRHQELTILGLAYESGFSSKATFNRVFTEIKGKTPSQFIKELKAT